MTKSVIICAVALGLLACQGRTQDTFEGETFPADVMINEEITTENLTNSDMSDAEKAAIDRFIYQEGDWSSVWTSFDASGRQTRQVQGTVNFAFLVDKHSQMLTNVIPALKHTSYAMQAYSPSEQHIIFLNVGPEGDYWIMRKNPITNVMISDPRVNADGTETVRMFTTLNEKPDSYEIIMEASHDGGETWAKEYHQTMTRITYEE